MLLHLVLLYSVNIAVYYIYSHNNVFVVYIVKVNDIQYIHYTMYKVQ